MMIQYEIYHANKNTNDIIEKTSCGGFNAPAIAMANNKKPNISNTMIVIKKNNKFAMICLFRLLLIKYHNSVNAPNDKGIIEKRSAYFQIAMLKMNRTFAVRAAIPNTPHTIYFFRNRHILSATRKISLFFI